jgi:YHS domain-containing protein
MSIVMKTAFCVTLASSLVWFAGCRQEPAAAPPAPAQPAPAVNPAEQPAGDASEAAKIEAAFASLSAEDRALAVKQKICPVSGEALGAMGAPMKVTVAGQEVFICCESCKDPLLEDPAKHLAKIGLQPAAETAPQ